MLGGLALTQGQGSSLNGGTTDGTATAGGGSKDNYGSQIFDFSYNPPEKAFPAWPVAVAVVAIAWLVVQAKKKGKG